MFYAHVPGVHNHLNTLELHPSLQLASFMLDERACDANTSSSTQVLLMGRG